jgi:hypothetical protein
MMLVIRRDNIDRLAKTKKGDVTPLFHKLLVSGRVEG